MGGSILGGDFKIKFASYSRKDAIVAMSPLFISIGSRRIVRQRRRTMMSVSAIALGIAALILASGFIQWNLWFGRESTIHSQLGHIRMHKPGYLDAGPADPFAYLVPDDARQRADIESSAHVEAVAPRLGFNGLISLGDATLSFIGEGVDPAKERLLSRSVTIVAGESLSAAVPKGIILGQGLAANLGVRPGDTVVLVVNTSSGAINAAEVRVLGLFATITKAYDDAAVRITIELAHQLLRVAGSHAYALVLDRTESTDAVVADLRAKFRGQPLEFVPWHEMADFYKKTAELFLRQVAVLRLIIAVIIVLSISNTMMMSVMERTGEIGTAMALGNRRADILRQFLSEGLLIGVSGGVLGLVLGYGGAKLISAIGIPMPAPPGMAFGYTAGIMMSWPLAGEAFVLAVATTLVASLYPAWKASRMNIVDALRHGR